MSLMDQIRQALSGHVPEDELDFAVLDAKRRNSLSNSDFAYIDSKGERHLPIYDKVHCQNALARFNQTKFESPTAKSKAMAKIRAAAAKFGIKTSSEVDFIHLASEFSPSKHRLFNELQEFAEPPEWIPFLPTPGEYSHPEYGSIKLSKDRNANFVANFDRGVYQKMIPIDLEHQLSMSGAAGYITGLRQNSDGSVDAQVEWTDMGQEVIKKDRFKYFSPAWRDKWINPLGQEFDDVVIGGALTTRPFFKETTGLRPLVASEKGLFFTEDEVTEATDEIELDQLPVVENKEDDTNDKQDDGEEGEELATSGRPVTINFIMNEKKEGSAMAGTENTENKVIQMTEEEYSKFKEMSEKFTAMAERNTQLEDSVRTLRNDARRKRFSEMAEKWAGDASKNINTLEKLADTLEGGEESDTFKEHVENMNAIAEQLRTSVLMTEVGANNGKYSIPSSASQKMVQLASEIRSADPKLSEEQAFVEAMMRNPQAYAEYEADKQAQIRNK